MSNDRIQYPIRMPELLKRRLDTEAKNRGMSTNALIVKMLQYSVTHLAPVQDIFTNNPQER
jgi:predicted HicB family RNase H-like nuclease